MVLRTIHFKNIFCKGINEYLKIKFSKGDDWWMDSLIIDLWWFGKSHCFIIFCELRTQKTDTKLISDIPNLDT